MGVEQHRAAGRNHRLPAVEFVELDAAPFEHAFHMSATRWSGTSSQPNIPARVFLVMSSLVGPSPPVMTTTLGIPQSAFHAPDDLCAVVADRNFLVYDDAGGVEVLGRWIRSSYPRSGR